MILNYISQENLYTLKSNTQTLTQNLVFDNELKLIQITDEENIFLKSRIEIKDFELCMEEEKAQDSDLENIKIIYSKTKFLSESQASDERLWVGLAFSQFFNYMVYRWPVAVSKDMDNHYFFAYSKQRSLIRHGLARLWWIGRMTYDDTRVNPYELTEFICKDNDYIESILGRNFSNNFIIVKAMLGAVIDKEKEGIKIDRFIIRELSKYINLLGSVYIIDSWNYDEIFNKIAKRIDSMK